jgi:hypothetical protein
MSPDLVQTPRRPAMVKAIVLGVAGSILGHLLVLAAVAWLAHTLFHGSPQSEPPVLKMHLVPPP